MADTPHIIAVGLLTQRDLDLLGQDFNRAFPLEDVPKFDDLLRAIDDADLAYRSRKPFEPT